MLIRHSRESDAEALASYDYSPQESWIAEVVEIVRGLLAWRDSALAADHGRQVLVLDDGGEVVAVCAHEGIDDGEHVFVNHRYLMVTAVWPDHEGRGLARLLVTSVFADLQQGGANGDVARPSTQSPVDRIQPERVPGS